MNLTLKDLESSDTSHLRRGVVQRYLLSALMLVTGMLPMTDVAVGDSRIPADAIRRSSQQVMEHNDFRSVRRRVLEEIPVDDMDEGFLEGLLGSIGDAISDFFAWLFPANLRRPPRAPAATPSSTPTSFDGFDLSKVISILAILIVAGALIWILAKILPQHRNDPNRSGIPSIAELAAEISVPPGELAVSTYESRAVMYGQKGDFSMAIRELLLGSMSWIERAGLIRFRKGLTNRDYVRAVWRQEEKRSAYLVTGSEFELIFFGRRAATEAMFERCLTAFQGAFREEATPERDDR